MTSTALLMRLGGTRLLLGLEHVAEVSRPLPATRLPGAPAWVVGAANWRGRVLPVVDLGGWFAGDALGAGADVPAPRRAGGRLVVVTVPLPVPASVGLAVTAVDATVPLDPGSVLPVPGHVPAATAAMLAGHVPAQPGGEGPCAVLDVSALARLARDLPQSRGARRAVGAVGAMA